MTYTKTVNKETLCVKSAETKIVQSFKPSLRQYWFKSILLAFSIFLSFKVFGVNTITGLTILSVIGLLIIYIILFVCTTKYVITQQGLLLRKITFSGRFKEINYSDINSIAVRQQKMQKRFKIGDLIINTEHNNIYIFKGVKNPNQVKELINKEKASEYERRTLLRKIL